MAPFASNRRKGRIAELVRGPCDEVHRAGMAEEAPAGDLVREIEMRFRLVAGRQVPAFGLCVVGNRRLKQISPQPDHIAVSDYAGPHGIGYGILGDYAATLEPMLQDRAALVDSDGAPGKLMDDAALGKNRWGADGSAHRGSRECSGFGGVAAGAEFLGAAYRNAAEQQDR